MTESKLRFRVGSPVVVELIGAEDPSACRFGYKVGDSWEVSVWENSGLCGLAYHNFFPFISLLQSNGDVVWKRQEKDRVIRTCPDLRAGFRFLIKKRENGHF